jgi:ABC-type antimicrobial peptide transport system permease subunit
MQNPTVVIRSNENPATLVAAIRREVKAAIPRVPPPVVRSMDEILADTVAQPRFQTWLLSLFGIVALALAVVGLSGVLAFVVAQRRREIGLRMALGAQRREVLRLVVAQGMRLALVGVTIGLAGALGLTRVLRGLLYEVTPTDPSTFASVSLLLLAVAVFACWLPARRAASVDPMEALRSE